MRVRMEIAQLLHLMVPSRIKAELCLLSGLLRLSGQVLDLSAALGPHVVLIYQGRSSERYPAPLLFKLGQGLSIWLLV